MTRVDSSENRGFLAEEGDFQACIATMPDASWQAEFQPVLHAVRDCLRQDAAPLLHSLYVYGSVAAGRAIPGKSDLDLCLILHRPPTDKDSEQIEKIRQELAGAYPIVSKIDFDIGSLDDLAAPETSMAWRYWIKHHCRCLAGPDLAADIAPFRPSRALAIAINGDFERVLGNYLQALAQPQSPATVRRLIREASRKLIRSTNVLRPATAITWPSSLDGHVDFFLLQFPGQEEKMRYFLAQAVEPDAGVGEFVARLKAFSGWMLGEVQAMYRVNG